MSFLTAQWNKLIMVNYQINPDILKTYLPYGVELDDYQGQHIVSLVGLEFAHTKIKGIGIPFHQTFGEVNLRFYVKQKQGDGKYRKGVVFISEIVPKRAIVWVANTLYKECYEYYPMSYEIEESKDYQQVRYTIENETTQTFSVTADTQKNVIVPESFESFIGERYSGYAKKDNITTIRYEVTHEPWSHYKVIGTDIDIDFRKLYGQEFSFLHDAKPLSTFLFEGSSISISHKKVIKK